MTDDISKVVREMRAVAEHPHATTPERKAARITDWADRLESATTPAEVELARTVEHGVQPMKGGKAWGVLYADGQSTSYGWIDPTRAPLHDPKFCKAATDVTYQGSPYRRELEGAELVAVTRTTVVTRQEPGA